MANAIIIDGFGKSEVLSQKQITLNKPNEDEVLIKHVTIGINHLDIHKRRGELNSHSNRNLPLVLGCEACGVVEEVGANVKEFQKGDRVAYATAPMSSTSGAYSEARVVHSKYLVPVPDYISDTEAAATLLKGMAAHYLLRRTFFATEKNIILVHAAASGVGQFLCMLGKHYGAKVIATVGTEEKKKIVQPLADLVINYTTSNFAEETLGFTNNQGAHVVYDSVGENTFIKSLDSLSDFGLMVNYGHTSGKVKSIPFSTVSKKSLFITSPSLFTYKQHREELMLSSNEVFSLVKEGVIKPSIFKEYKLSEAQEAHRNMEDKKSIGQSIFVL